MHSNGVDGTLDWEIPGVHSSKAAPVWDMVMGESGWNGAGVKADAAGGRHSEAQGLMGSHKDITSSPVTLQLRGAKEN